MRLAMAMRKGGRLYPQSRGRYGEIGPSGRVLGLCALGAAAAGAGWRVTDAAKGEWDFERRLEQQWPSLEQPQTCPVPSCKDGRAPVGSLREVVVHLNDDHGWAVDQIADWLDAIDAAASLHGERPGFPATAVGI